MTRIGVSNWSTAAEAWRPPRASRVAATLVAVLAAMPAAAQSKGERLDMLEERMSSVERQLENQGLLEMSRRIDALAQELRQLRGQVEQSQHELATARKQQRDQYVDLDTRLKAAEAALTAAQSAVPGGTPEAEYQAAFNLLKDGQYDQAAAALQDFLTKHKDHELASNAMYWLGEAHYVRRDYPPALAAFEGMLGNYPGARKAPDALLKAAYCQYELKRYAPARATLMRLVQEFPGTQAATEGQQRLDRMRAEGR
ncbi:MAG: tol-pal system protein YbgF [Steroidobacteraceae bacterium]